MATAPTPKAAPKGKERPAPSVRQIKIKVMYDDNSAEQLVVDGDGAHVRGNEHKVRGALQATMLKREKAATEVAPLPPTPPAATTPQTPATRPAATPAPPADDDK